MAFLFLTSSFRRLAMFLCRFAPVSRRLPLAYGSTPRQPRTAISETANVDCGNIKKGLAPYIGNLLGLSTAARSEPLRARAGRVPQLRLNGG
ncbi:hypothetical protein F5144DRAFT_320937 [Chaetomium tenue]|uniref:Uncharacterized protein n=1 Tax=Chaetomium tenue TaxID=1854479 RepID=A0ACB7P446_9PEZI|nr:hypothetical protein F5144DRAFT_320937 [Chaetomium globosum]